MAPPVYVVSGLPRSGTSMLMRMLAAGGMPILDDGRRGADPDNPRGYFELEAVKGTARDASWIRAAPGKAVKVISYLLPHLPSDLEYRVLFLRRDLAQVVRSQRAMLDRLGAGLEETDARARGALAEHLAEVESWLDGKPHIRRLGVGHARVLADPRREAERMAAFLDVALDPDAMAGAVEPGLWRQR